MIKDNNVLISNDIQSIDKRATTLIGCINFYLENHLLDEYNEKDFLLIESKTIIKNLLELIEIKDMKVCLTIREYNGDIKKVKEGDIVEYFNTKTEKIIKGKFYSHNNCKSKFIVITSDNYIDYFDNNNIKDFKVIK